VSQTVRILKRRKPKTIDEAIQILQQLIPPNFHRGQRRNTPKIPRVIPWPKIGGFLPLIPILTARGCLARCHDVKNCKEQLSEATRHNR